MNVLQERLLTVLGQTARIPVPDATILSRLQERWPTEHGYSQEIVRRMLDQLEKDGLVHRSASGKWTRMQGRSSAAPVLPPEPTAAPEPPADEPHPETEPEPDPVPTEDEPMSKEKTCSVCGNPKPVADFPKIGAQCKACIAKKAAAAYQAKKKNAAKPAKAAKSPKTAATAIANLRAKAARRKDPPPATLPPTTPQKPLISRQYVITIEDIRGEQHVISVDQDTVSRLAVELQEQAA